MSEEKVGIYDVIEWKGRRVRLKMSYGYGEKTYPLLIKETENYFLVRAEGHSFWQNMASGQQYVKPTYHIVEKYPTDTMLGYEMHVWSRDYSRADAKSARIEAEEKLFELEHIKAMSEVQP